MKKKYIKIMQIRSPIGCPKKQREVLKGLGLRKIRQVVKRPNNEAILGMVRKIPHLVKILED